jgi:hypothetical protein
MNNNQYYILARYPIGLHGDILHEVYASDQTQETISSAQRALNWVACMLSCRDGATA